MSLRRPGLFAYLSPAFCILRGGCDLNMGSFAKGRKCGKFCGNSAENVRKLGYERVSALTEFPGANSVSSSQPDICVPRRTHRVFRRTHRVCRRTLSEFSLPKQDSPFPNFFRAGYPDPPFHVFFSQKAWVSPRKRGFSVFFALFCTFGPKKAPFPHFRIVHPRFFRQNCAFWTPQLPLSQRKKHG